MLPLTHLKEEQKKISWGLRLEGVTPGGRTAAETAKLLSTHGESPCLSGTTFSVLKNWGLGKGNEFVEWRQQSGLRTDKL